MLTQARLRELLTYEPDTGLFWRNVTRASNARRGSIAGYAGDPYARIRIDGELYLAHRLAYLYMTGQWPPDDIDHRNGRTKDNRWENLRPATRQQNMHNKRRPMNNSSGIKGVARVKYAHEFWRAEICLNHRTIFLGHYVTREEAALARHIVEQALFGEFAYQK